MLAALVMLAITAIKFAALFHFGGYYWDLWAKMNRALLAVSLGPARIYDPGLPVDAYPPGSLYLLWMDCPVDPAVGRWVSHHCRDPAADS
jgi:hypothetical protein